LLVYEPNKVSFELVDQILSPCQTFPAFSLHHCLLWLLVC
jgi:hypothetical protein